MLSAVDSRVTSSEACSKCCGDGRTWASSPGRPAFAHSRCAWSTPSSSVSAHADLVAALGRLAAGLLLERRHHVRVVLGADEAVGDPAGDLECLGAEGRHVDRWRLLGQRVDPGGVDLVVPTLPGDDLAGPELPDHLDGLLQHLEADVERRPWPAEHVLVERLTRADTEREPAAEHPGRGRGRLGDDRGMGPDRRTGHGGRHGQRAGLGQRADDRPDERALTLLVVPWVEVVADPERVEARRLRSRGLLDELLG